MTSYWIAIGVLMFLLLILPSREEEEHYSLYASLDELPRKNECHRQWK